MFFISICNVNYFDVDIYLYHKETREKIAKPISMMKATTYNQHTLYQLNSLNKRLKDTGIIFAGF